MLTPNRTGMSDFAMQPIGDNKRQERRHGDEAVDEERRKVPKHRQESEDGNCNCEQSSPVLKSV